jgi:hypothetical protein
MRGIESTSRSIEVRMKSSIASSDAKIKDFMNHSAAGARLTMASDCEPLGNVDDKSI